MPAAIDHHHARVLAAQPEEELFQQFFVAAHGQAREHQGVDFLNKKIDSDSNCFTGQPRLDLVTLIPSQLPVMRSQRRLNLLV